MSIGRQVTRGVFWVGLSTLTTQTLAFITRLVLLRILLRTDFGLVASATVAISALQLFREFGFGEALIYRRDRVREAADTMFVLLFVISLVLYGLALLGAVPIATFFYPGAAQLSDRAQLAEILRILGMIMVIGSLGQVPLTMLAREMDFRKRLLPDIVPEVIKDTVTIVLALKGFGVWSLVYGQLVDITLTAILAWVVAPLRPRPRIHLSVAREMFAYGKHIQASQILIYFITNLDNMFVSRMRGADDLGVYSQAFTLSNTPATHITRLLGQVMFPALSRVSASLADVRRVFLRAVKYTAMVSIPLSVAIFVFTPPFMDILYGAKWMNAIVPMQLLVIYGGIRSIAANMGPVFKAGGKPQWLVGIATWRLATMLILLYPATVWYGIVGVSALSAMVAVADLIISAILVNRIISTDMKDFAQILAPFLGLSIVAATIARAVLWALQGIYPPFALLMAGITMVIVYGVLVWRVDSEARNRIVGLLSEVPLGMRVLHMLRIDPQAAVPVDQP